MNFAFWKDVAIDTLVDAARLFPFLLITYIFMEYLEHHTEKRSLKWLEKSGPFGPFIGAITGMLPQCGFSAAASNLYAARVISLGSLIAVYLSTSDEMLPLMISSQVPVETIVKLLCAKAVIGVAAGIVIDLMISMHGRKKTGNEETHYEEEAHEESVADVTAATNDDAVSAAVTKSDADYEHKHDHGHNHDHDHDHAHDHDHGNLHIHELCEREHCDCEKHGIFVSALLHSLHILLFIILITFAMNAFMDHIGSAGIQYITIGQSYGIVILASLFGLIPNCGISVALTQLYLGGMIGEGALMSGLLVGAGVGLLVLLRVNRPIRDTIKVIGVLWVIGVIAGCLIKALGITFMV